MSLSSDALNKAAASMDDNLHAMISQNLVAAVRLLCLPCHTRLHEQPNGEHQKRVRVCTALSHLDGIDTNWPPATSKTTPLWGCSFHERNQSAIKGLCKRFPLPAGGGWHSRWTV